MTRGFYNYAAQSVIPCACGSRDSYWHGATTIPPGRVYCCDRCWERADGNAATWEAQHEDRQQRQAK